MILSIYMKLYDILQSKNYMYFQPPVLLKLGSRFGLEKNHR